MRLFAFSMFCAAAASMPALSVEAAAPWQATPCPSKVACLDCQFTGHHRNCCHPLDTIAGVRWVKKAVDRVHESAVVRISESRSMPQHQAYQAPDDQPYYFRPYSVEQVLRRQEEIAAMGGDPRNPYDNRALQAAASAAPLKLEVLPAPKR